MSIRIIVERGETGDVVRVSGRLVGEAALGDLLRAAETASAPLSADLSDLRFADEEALRALRSLREKGVKLLGASPYIRLLMGS